MTVQPLSQSNQCGWITSQSQIEKCKLTTKCISSTVEKLTPFTKLIAEYAIGPEWITPEKQLEKLAAPIAQKVSQIVRRLIPEIANTIAKYATEYGDWYIALDELGILPEIMPPLPENMIDIFESRCPVHGKKRKQYIYGDFYKVKDTHILVPVLKEFISLNHFETVLKAYSERHYPKGEKPLQFGFFHPTVKAKYGELPIETSGWDLLTEKPLPETNDKRVHEQMKMIESLNKQAFLDYKAPSIHGTFLAIFFRKIVKKANLYESTDAMCDSWKCKKHPNFRYTHVKSELFPDSALIIGNFTEKGVELGCYDIANCIGMAARRVLYS